MEEDKNYGQFVVPYGKRYLGRRLFEIDGAWLVKQRRDEDKFEQVRVSLRAQLEVS